MIHHVFANRSNAGDWLSAKGIQRMLGSEELVEHLCDEPFVPSTLDALAAATGRDAIVIGGGGLFMDYFAPFWRGLLPIAGRVPTYIWGAGYCDLKLEASRCPPGLLLPVVRASRLCVVRDELSRGLLGLTGLPSPVPCPSLAVIEPALEAGFGLLHAANYTTVGAEAYDRMCEAGQAFATRTGRVYRETNNEIPSGNADRISPLLSLYAHSDIVLSSRLHGCIFAVAMGRPIVAVSGDWKVESFMQAAGLQDWVCDIHDLEDLPRLLKRAHEQTPVPHFVERVRRSHADIARSITGRAAHAGIASRAIVR